MSQPERLADHDKIAVIAAAISVEIASAGDQHQPMRAGLLERLVVRCERLFRHFANRRHPIFEPVRLPAQRNRVANLDPQ